MRRKQELYNESSARGGEKEHMEEKGRERRTGQDRGEMEILQARENRLRMIPHAADDSRLEDLRIKAGASEQMRGRKESTRYALANCNR